MNEVIKPEKRDEINERLAQFCGWKKVPGCKETCGIITWESPDGGSHDYGAAYFPNYLSDGNAMLELLKVLEEKGWEWFVAYDPQTHGKHECELTHPDFPFSLEVADSPSRAVALAALQVIDCEANNGTNEEPKTVLHKTVLHKIEDTSPEAFEAWAQSILDNAQVVWGADVDKAREAIPALFKQLSLDRTKLGGSAATTLSVARGGWVPVIILDNYPPVGCELPSEINGVSISYRVSPNGDAVAYRNYLHSNHDCHCREGIEDVQESRDLGYTVFCNGPNAWRWDPNCKDCGGTGYTPFGS